MWFEILVTLLLISCFVVVLLPENYKAEHTEFEHEEIHNKEKELILGYGLYENGERNTDVDYIIADHNIYDSEGQSVLKDLDIQTSTVHAGSIGETKYMESDAVEGSSIIETDSAESKTMISTESTVGHIESDIVSKQFDSRVINSNSETEIDVCQSESSSSVVEFSNVKRCTFVDEFVESKKYSIPEIDYKYPILQLDDSLSGFSFVIDPTNTIVEFPPPSDGLYFRINGTHHISTNYEWITNP